MGYFLLSWNYGRNTFTPVPNHLTSQGTVPFFRTISTVWLLDAQGVSEATSIHFHIILLYFFFLSYKPHMSLESYLLFRKAKVSKANSLQRDLFLFLFFSQENLKWRRWHLSKISILLTLKRKKFLCSDYTTNMELFFRIGSEFDCYSITYMFYFFTLSLPVGFRSDKIQCYIWKLKNVSMADLEVMISPA